MTSEISIPDHRVAIFRWVFGIYFLFFGVLHFIVPDGLPGPMSWMYELSDTVHYVAGTAEVLGGLGLILPRLTGIVPRLTSLAAAGLTVLMIGALVWHAGRGEPALAATNALVAILLAYVAITEWKQTALN